MACWGRIPECGFGCPAGCEGPAKKTTTDGPPCTVHLLYLQPTCLCLIYTKLLFCLTCFSRQGEFKKTIHIFLWFVGMLCVENFIFQNYQKNAKSYHVSFSTAFLIYRVFGCLSAMGDKKTLQKLFAKLKSGTVCFRFFCHFGRFSARGGS